MHYAEEAEVPADSNIAEPESLVPGYLLDSGEIVLLAIKPSVWFLMLVSIRWLLAAALVILLAPLFESSFPSFLTERALTLAAVIFTAARLLVALLQWSSRLYVLTNRRVMSCRGVLQVSIFEAPLVHIRNTYLQVRSFEKALGVGSIGFAVGGSKRVDAWWDQVNDPIEVHQRVRRAIENALDNHPPF